MRRGGRGYGEEGTKGKPKTSKGGVAKGSEMRFSLQISN